MKLRLALVGAFLLIAATGCKGETSTKAQLATTTTGIPATTTTTTKEHGYRVQYLNAVSGINCLNARHNDMLKRITPGRDYYTAADWPRIRTELQPLLKSFGDGMVSFYQDLARLEWPASAAEDIRLLTREATGEASALLAEAEAKTYADFIALPARSSDGAQAAAVRAILGLPTNLVEDNFDWCQGPPELEPTPPVPVAPTSATPGTTATATP